MVDRANKGFSLVELIIVIAIMSILVGVLVPTYFRFVEKSREASDIQCMDHAMDYGKMAFASLDYTFGDEIYYYDGDIIDDKPSSYGRGHAMVGGFDYPAKCCDEGDYDPRRDYTNSVIQISFTGTSNEDVVVHVHWVEQ